MQPTIISNLTNLGVIGGILTFLALPVLMITTNMNLENASPDDFLAVQIEGEAAIKELLYDDKPFYSPDAITSWVTVAANHFYNYDINNYKVVFKEGKKYIAPEIADEFVYQMAVNAKKNFEAGWLITRSNVEIKPMLIQQGTIDGIQYYKYFLKTSTMFKSEQKPAYKNLELTITVRLDDPTKNIRGISIESLKCRNC